MSAGPQSTDDGEPLNEVNVIPLADLSLVLLIILMVLSPMVMQSMIKVQNTKASRIASLSQKPPEPPLILEINADGSTLLNKTAYNDMDLAVQLLTQLANREEKTVLLTTDPGAEHGRFVRVLDLVKQQGADKIALLKKAAPSAPARGPAKR